MAIQTSADVAAKVRGVAAEKRETQASLASILGISSMAMSRRFAGQTPFAPEELIYLAGHLGVPVSTFFGETAEGRQVGAA